MKKILCRLVYLNYLNNFYAYFINLILDFDSMYTSKVIHFKGDNNSNKNQGNRDFYNNDREDNFSVNSNNNNNNFNDKKKFLENNNSKFNSNIDFNSFKNASNDNTPYRDRYVHKNIPLTNLWEDTIHKKIKNLEMTNDDLDEMFNVFNDNKKINPNKK